MPKKSSFTKSAPEGGHNLESTPRRGKRSDTSHDKDLSEQHREEISDIIGRIKQNRGQEIPSAFEIGKDLLRAKDLVGHGNFLSWLGSEFCMSSRTARNYMDLARHLEGKLASVASLDLSTVYALVAKSTPENVRDDVIRRAEAGESMTFKEVRERIAASKRAAETPQVTERDEEIQEEALDAMSRTVDDLEPKVMGLTTNDNKPGLAGDGPENKLLDAIMNFANAVWEHWDQRGESPKSAESKCDAHDVAAVLSKSEHVRIRPGVQRCAKFLREVQSALLSMESVGPLRRMSGR